MESRKRTKSSEKASTSKVKNIETNDETKIRKEKHIKTKESKKLPKPKKNVKTTKTSIKNTKEKTSKLNTKSDVPKSEKIKNQKRKVNNDSESSEHEASSSKKKIKIEKNTLSEVSPKKQTNSKIKKEIEIKEEISDDKANIGNITREMVRYSNKWVGAHVSISGGLFKAVEEACKLESNAFGLFLRSQRRWDSPPLTQKSIDEFEKTIKEKKFGCSESNCESYFDSIKNQILPHGSYLINLGNPDKEKRNKSYGVFIDDLKRCDALSIALYNFHPGSTCGDTTIENSIKFIAENINKAHKETKHVKILIENMAGQGNIVGSKFEELADIIKLVENKDRIGICLDTCHLFAAGYDVRTADAWNKILDDFEKIVGLKYLSALHLNDSKGQLGCNKDRHESIGKGYIGLDCFKFIMEDSRFCNMPLILETPDEKLYYKEIQLLHSFLKIKKEEK